MRVVLGEDLTLLRDGLIRMLAAYGMEVVEAVDNGPALLRALVAHRPDVAVVDVRTSAVTAHLLTTAPVAPAADR